MVPITGFTIQLYFHAYKEFQEWNMSLHALVQVTGSCQENHKTLD